MAHQQLLGQLPQLIASSRFQALVEPGGDLCVKACACHECIALRHSLPPGCLRLCMAAVRGAEEYLRVLTNERDPVNLYSFGAL